MYLYESNKSHIIFDYIIFIWTFILLLNIFKALLFRLRPKY